MAAILKRMGVGVPGSISRPTAPFTTEPCQLDATTGTPTNYGVPLVEVAGKVRAMGAGNVATDYKGILVRVFPTTPGGAAVYPGGSNIPNQTIPNDILKTGYIVVALSTGSVDSAKGGAVYVRVAAAATGKPIGGFEAAADATPANTVLLPNTYFTGPRDAAGAVEIHTTAQNF